MEDIVLCDQETLYFLINLNFLIGKLQTIWLKHHAKNEGYNIQILGVIFKRVTECIVKNLFPRYKMCHNSKNTNAIKKIIPYRYRPLRPLSVWNKTFKAFIKPFEAPQRSVKIKL